MEVQPAAESPAMAAAPRFVLDRREAVPALIGRHEDFLIVTGLAGTARDVAALTRDGAHAYTMAGAMGGAAMLGLGLALARRDRRVLVVTGDGELLMNVGALATIAVIRPRRRRAAHPRGQRHRLRAAAGQADRAAELQARDGSGLLPRPLPRRARRVITPD